MKVIDILKTKSYVLFTTTPETSLQDAVNLMAEKDLGSLVVLENGQLIGMLTFRELLITVSKNQGGIANIKVKEVMEQKPLVLSPEVDVFETRQKMLETHSRYVPIMEGTTLMGILSFYDVAKSMLQAQQLENEMLKAYIRDWPEDDKNTFSAV